MSKPIKFDLASPNSLNSKRQPRCRFSSIAMTLALSIAIIIIIIIMTTKTVEMLDMTAWLSPFKSSKFSSSKYTNNWTQSFKVVNRLSV